MDIIDYDEGSCSFPQIRAEGVNEGLYKALYLLNKQEEVPSRDGTTKEVLNCRFIHTEPRDRFIRLKGRKHNVFHQIGETLWVLSGDGRLDLLSIFLPRAEQFSDDGGETWRSAYGPRLRSYNGETDQLKAVVEKLASSKETRRAFIVLTYPPVDHSDGVDVVCNVALQFIVRNGRLHMTIHNRSNDSVWGYSAINFFEFTVLQETIRSLLFFEHGISLDLGSYVHNSVSYHVYSRHYERMNGILTSNGGIDPFVKEKHYPIAVKSLESMDKALKEWRKALMGLKRLIKKDGAVDTEQMGYIVQRYLENNVEGTLPVYAASTLLYAGKALSQRSDKSSLEGKDAIDIQDVVRAGYSKLLNRYHGSAKNYGVKEPMETYFMKAITEKLFPSEVD